MENGGKGEKWVYTRSPWGGANKGLSPNNGLVKKRLVSDFHILSLVEKS